MTGRYDDLETYQVPDRRGRTVDVVPAPARPAEATIGVHRRRDGQRTDHIAARYLGDGAAGWRIAEENDAMLIESLTEKRDVQIPKRGS